MSTYDWQNSAASLPQTSDLDRSIALGIRKTAVSPSDKSDNKPQSNSNSPNPVDLMNRTRPKSEPQVTRPSNSANNNRPNNKKIGNEDENEGPPPIINLFAENYKFRFAERNANTPIRPPRAVSEPVRRIVPILIEYDPNSPERTPQKERKVHFFPEKDDVVPKHATIFDIDQALFEYNERISERQMYALYQAQVLCEQPTLASSAYSTYSPYMSNRQQQQQQQQRFSTAQRCIPRNMMYNDSGSSSSPGYASAVLSQQQQQALRVRAYVPPKQKRFGNKSNGGGSNRPSTADPGGFADRGLTDTLTISKVALPTSPRRPNSHKEPPNKANKQILLTTKQSTGQQKGPKRYRSPPPRAFRPREAKPQEVRQVKGEIGIKPENV